MEWRKRNDRGETYVWCETEEEINDFLDIAEFEGYVWNSSSRLKPRARRLERNYNMLFLITSNDRLLCAFYRNKPSIINVFAQELHNYAISVRLKRGDTRD